MLLEPFLAAAGELLAIPSTEDRPAELHRALDFTLDYVGRNYVGRAGSGGFTVERFERDGKPSALVHPVPAHAGPVHPGPARPEFRVILNAHLDVVPAPPEQFRPYRAGGRLYARGAHDMKVSALAEAHVFATLAADLPYPLALQLVTDEEVGGHNGTGYQLEQGVTGRFVIIGEQTGLRLVTESKGLLRVVLTATGRGGHGAYPWLGDNALVKLMRSVEAVLVHYPTPAAEVWRTTVNVARVETPNEAANQIPAQAAAWLDIRFPPEDADLFGRPAEAVGAFLAGFCEPGVAVVVERLEQPHLADRERAEIKRLDRAARDQGYPGGFLRKHGAGDGRYYSQRGIAAVTFGIDGDGQHGPEEYVEIASVEPYARALTQFLLAPG